MMSYESYKRLSAKGKKRYEIVYAVESVIVMTLCIGLAFAAACLMGLIFNALGV